jgi:hypothetical protein
MTGKYMIWYDLITECCSIHHSWYTRARQLTPMDCFQGRIATGVCVCGGGNTPPPPQIRQMSARLGYKVVVISKMLLNLRKITEKGNK